MGRAAAFQRAGQCQAGCVGAGLQHAGVVDAARQWQAPQQRAERLAQQLAQLREQGAQVDLAAQGHFHAGVHQLLGQPGAQHHGLAHRLQVGFGAGVRQLLAQPAQERAVPQHHQRTAQRIDAAAQAQGGRIGIGQKAVGQQRVFAQNVFKHVQRLLGLDGLEQLEQRGMGGLQRLVAQAVQHIVLWPSDERARALLVQAQVGQRTAGDAFVQVARLQRAVAGTGLQGLQCVFRCQGEQPVCAKTGGQGAAAFGLLRGLATPDQRHTARPGRLHLLRQRSIAQPGTRHHHRKRRDQACWLRRRLQHTTQQRRGLRCQQKRRRMCQPQLAQRVQQVRDVQGRGGRVGSLGRHRVGRMHGQLHAHQRTRAPPQRAVAQNQPTENRLHCTHPEGKKKDKQKQAWQEWQAACGFRFQRISVLTGCAAIPALPASAAGPHPNPLPEGEGAKPATRSTSAKTPIEAPLAPTPQPFPQREREQNRPPGQHKNRFRKGN